MPDEEQCLKYGDRIKENVNLHLAIKKELEPIFRDLSDQQLLTKCLSGKTQDDNESLNSIIRRKCPRSMFFGRQSIINCCTLSNNII